MKSQYYSFHPLPSSTTPLSAIFMNFNLLHYLCIVTEYVSPEPASSEPLHENSSR
jgi:hypothetical protein